MKPRNTIDRANINKIDTNKFNSLSEQQRQRENALIALETAKTLERTRIKLGWRVMVNGKNSVLVSPDRFNEKKEVGFKFFKK